MSDQEGAFFEPCVVEKGPRRGRRPQDQRLVLDGVFWIARTGAAWRDLHSHFGTWNSVYRQFQRCTLAGLWDVMLEKLIRPARVGASVQMIDSTIIRAHQHAAGAVKKGMRTRVLAALVVALDQIHLRMSAHGLPVAVTLSGGQVSDVKGYAPVMDEPGPKPAFLFADKGYDADFILADLQARASPPSIPPSATAK